MTPPPYSLKDAQHLTQEYHYLIGQPFAKEDNIFIENIIVCPFDEASRKRFLIFYFLFNDADKALSQEYKGLLFDVLVIGRSKTDVHELQQESIFTWLNANKPMHQTMEILED